MKDVANPTTWASALPDGAVSVEGGGDSVILKASAPLQTRFETLLERKKSGGLTETESTEYEAICKLDEALSWLNRLARKN